MLPAAVVLAHGHYRTPYAKTAHGLVRGPSRYRVVAVVDPECAGQDAGTLLDGIARGVPVIESVGALASPVPSHCVVGVATEGGRLPPELRGDLGAAADAGMTLVNGLHELLSDDPELAQRAKSIVDLRRPRPVSELAYWTGDVLALDVPRVAVLGTDCAIGKRTTTVLVRDGLRARGVAAEAVYTGQTGWLQGLEHGFLFDATPNDFVSGELERAVLACARERRPEVILIEGQSALRNPSGPAGAELLLSAGARGVILQHAPARACFEGFEHLNARIPPITEELQLVRLYGSEVWAVAVNEKGLAPAAMREACARLEDELAVPVLRPLGGELEVLVDVVRARLGGSA